jgi:hypothetical protein
MDEHDDDLELEVEEDATGEASRFRTPLRIWRALTDEDLALKRRRANFTVGSRAPVAGGRNGRRRERELHWPMPRW